MTKLPVALATLTATTVTCLGLGTSIAFADDDREVERSGSCSAGARWELKGHEDDGGLEVEGEVDSDTVGQAWRWTLKDNGAVIARGTSTTAGRSGSFDVERLVPDLAGSDNLVFKATYAGQTCRGSLTW